MTQAAASDLTTQLSKLREQEKTNRETEIRLLAEQDSIERELAAAQTEAIGKFETADLGKLRGLYQQYVEQDKQAVSVFSDVVTRRAAMLEDIQRRLAAHRAGQTQKA